MEYQSERLEQVPRVAFDQDTTIVAVVEMSQSSWLVGVCASPVGSAHVAKRRFAVWRCSAGCRSRFASDVNRKKAKQSGNQPAKDG
jgi:hypothetical protein